MKEENTPNYEQENTEKISHFKDLNDLRNFCKNEFDKKPYYKKQENGSLDLFLMGEVIGKLDKKNINKILHSISKQQLKTMVEEKNNKRTYEKTEQQRIEEEKKNKFQSIIDKGLVVLYDQLKDISIKKGTFNTSTKIDEVMEEYLTNFHYELNDIGFTSEDTDMLRNDIKECWKVLRNEVEDLTKEHHRTLIAEYREDTYGIEFNETMELLEKEDTKIELIDNDLVVEFVDKNNKINAEYTISNSGKDIEEKSYKLTDIRQFKNTQKETPVVEEVKEQPKSENKEKNIYKEVSKKSEIKKEEKTTSKEEEPQHFSVMSDLYNYLKAKHSIVPNIVNKEKDGTKYKMLLVGNKPICETLDMTTNKLRTPIDKNKLDNFVGEYKTNQEEKTKYRIQQIEQRKAEIRLELLKIEEMKRNLSRELTKLDNKLKKIDSEIEEKQKLLNEMRERRLNNQKNKENDNSEVLKEKKPSLSEQLKDLENDVSEYDNEVSKFNDTYGDKSSNTDNEDNNSKRKNK